MNNLDFLTAHDIAEILKISYENALAFIKYSGVEHIQIGRQYRVARDKLVAFMQRKGIQHINLQP